MKSPCLGCEERKYKCHSICNKYIEFKNELERVRIIRNKEMIKKDAGFIGKRKIRY